MKKILLGQFSKQSPWLSLAVALAFILNTSFPSPASAGFNSIGCKFWLKKKKEEPFDPVERDRRLNESRLQEEKSKGRGVIFSKVDELIEEGKKDPFEFERQRVENFASGNFTFEEGIALAVIDSDSAERDWETLAMKARTNQMKLRARQRSSSRFAPDRVYGEASKYSKNFLLLFPRRVADLQKLKDGLRMFLSKAEVGSQPQRRRNNGKAFGGAMANGGFEVLMNTIFYFQDFWKIEHGPRYQIIDRFRTRLFVKDEYLREVLLEVIRGKDTSQMTDLLAMLDERDQDTLKQPGGFEILLDRLLEGRGKEETIRFLIRYAITIGLISSVALAAFKAFWPRKPAAPSTAPDDLDAIQCKPRPYMDREINWNCPPTAPNFEDADISKTTPRGPPIDPFGAVFIGYVDGADSKRNIPRNAVYPQDTYNPCDPKGEVYELYTNLQIQLQGSANPDVAFTNWVGKQTAKYKSQDVSLQCDLVNPADGDPKNLSGKPMDQARSLIRYYYNLRGPSKGQHISCKEYYAWFERCGPDTTRTAP